jgi:hypothetical protein
MTTLCGKNMGNDLLIIPCDLPNGHAGECERNAWPVNEPSAPSVSEPRTVKLGVIEFHSNSFNPGLVERFFAVTKDLRDSASIVDLWLMDIATVLREFGYEMTITTAKEEPHVRM